MNDSRRFLLAVGVSLLAHALLLAIVPRTPSVLSQLTAAPPPLTVRIMPAEDPVEQPAAAETAPEVRPPSSARPPPPPAVVRRREPRGERAPITAPQAPAPSVAPAAPPPMDMLAMIEARRESRRTADEARRRPPAVEVPPEDAAKRNLGTLTGREGVGGVFQILRKGTRTAEFAFNGWRPDVRSRWREVYEVDAGQGGDIERAIVRRMIALIRTHYTGDFNWESHRLGRVVILSARAEDNPGLEDFLMREFFGQPTLNPRGDRPRF